MADQDIRVRISVDGASSAGSTLNKAAADVRKVGDSAGYTKQQLQQLNFQLTDIFTGLATGQSPLTVMLQQGGQLKDMFGGMGGAARALGSGIASMLSPTTLLAGALGGLGFAFVQGFRESAELRESLQLTGNAAGQTAASFDLVAQRTADMSAATIGASRELTAALIATGQFGSTALETIAVAAARLQSATGQTSGEVVKDLAGMSKGVADWASQHNQAWHFATEAQLQHIRSLEDTGNAQAAMVAVGQALIDHLGDQRERLGYVETAWLNAAKAASSFWEAVKEIGRDQTVEDRLSRINRELERGPIYAGAAAAQPSIGRSALESERDNLLRLQRREFDTAKDREVAAERERQLGALSALTGRLSGANSQYTKDLQQILGLSEALNLSEKQRLQLFEMAATKYGQKPSSPKTKKDEDRLGDFILDQVNAQDRRDNVAAERAAREAEQRNERIANFGFQLRDQAAQINASLISDDRQRGLMQIEIERETMQRRLDLMAASGDDLTAAQEALNANILAKQQALNEQLKPAWERMTDGWADAMRTMRETYDDAMSGILRDSEDIFVNLAKGKFDAKALLGNLQDTLLRDMFRQHFGNDVKTGASKFLGLLGLGPAGKSDSQGSSASSWETDLSKLLGTTDKQTDAADASARAFGTVGKMVDLFGDLIGTASSGVVQFIAGLAGNGNQYGWLAAIASIWGGGGTGSGITSGNTGLVDYGLGGGRAYGGAVRAGMDYTVGENGIETLRMFHGGGGMVTPMGGNGAGARTGQTVNNYYITCQAGVSPAQMHAYGVELGKAIEGRVNESAARPGRPLNRAARGY